MRTLWVVLCCLTVAAGYAQEVVKENGKIIIDASAIRHTKIKKARATDGTNARLGTDNETNIGSAASDEQVYYRFELSAARFSATWINAVNRCKNLTNDGGGWRLPPFDHFADVDVRQRLVIRLGDLGFVLVVNAQVVFKRIPVEILVCDYVLYFFHLRK